MRTSRKVIAAAATIAGLVGIPVAALATPGSGVTGTILAQGSTVERVKVNASGATDVVVRLITVAPGGSTGWHYHDGTLVAVVKSGTLMHFDDHCMARAYAAGQSFVEPSGAHHVHIGRNLGTEPVELYVTYVDPAGSPLSEDAPAPRCDG